MSKKEKIIVYTDGSCSGNGNTNAIGGIGIHFPNGELKDVSKIFNHEYCTNQRTELYAILTAIRYIKQNLGLDNYKILIKTDSQYSIDCVTKWIYGWIKNGWKTKNNTSVANREFIELIHKYYEKYDIAFDHVDAHTDMSDEESIANAMADKLATMATKKAQLLGKKPKNIKLPKKIEKNSSERNMLKPKNNYCKGYPTDDNIIVELVKAPK